MTEKELFDKFQSLKRDCLDNPVFQALLVEVEDSILSGIKKSEKDAVLAHYEYLALQRILSKLQSIRFEAEKHKEIFNKGIEDYRNY